jgi:alginate O-acetyltransferase complex protein AlgJ
LTDTGTAGIAEVVKTIVATRTTLLAGGTQLLVAVVAMKARFYASELPDGVALSAGVTARYAAILSRLSAAGIATFDVDAAMKTIAEPTFFRTDDHWTEWSAEAVAQACAKALEGLAPCRRRRRHCRRSARSRRISTPAT